MLNRRAPEGLATNCAVHNSLLTAKILPDRLLLLCAAERPRTPRRLDARAASSFASAFAMSNSVLAQRPTDQLDADELIWIRRFILLVRILPQHKSAAFWWRLVQEVKLSIASGGALIAINPVGAGV
jgi:hypothetical protein